MTIERMAELLEIEHRCMLRKSHDECNSDCGHCDLVQDDSELHEMYNDVIALLKAQIPRVMTFDEVMSGETEIAWTEADSEDGDYKWFYPGLIFHRDEKFESCFMGVICEGGRDNYGKEIRCWTSKPTDEQRKATKWDFEDGGD